VNYDKIAQMVKRQITDKGRGIVLSKLATAPDANKPWRGPSTPFKVEQFSTFGLFAVPNTSIPTESRGLGLDWIDQDLLSRSRRVVIVAALDAPDLEQHKVLTLGSEDLVLIWGQCFQPGSVKLFYVFGLAQ
jgi:hypothetical protein